MIFQHIKHRHREPYDEEATLDNRAPGIVEDPLSTTAQVTRQFQVGEVQSSRWARVRGYNGHGIVGVFGRSGLRRDKPSNETALGSTPTVSSPLTRSDHQPCHEDPYKH